MAALGFAALTFVCTFGFALLGTAIRARLPEAHLSKESQDTIRLGMGLVATMTALLLGLVTAAAKGSFDSTDTAVRNAASGVLALDRLLARYGPETAPARQQLKQAVAERIDTMWGSGNAPIVPSAGQRIPGEELESKVLELTPSTDSQRWLRTEALKLCEEILRTRWRVLGSSGGSVPFVFLVVVVFWLATTFGSFGLSAPRNATVVTILGISALSVAAAVFLILELDGPFTGVIKISSRPLQYALANLGH